MPLSQPFLKKLKTSNFSISSCRSTVQRWRVSFVALDDKEFEALTSSMDMSDHCATDVSMPVEVLHAWLLPVIYVSWGSKAPIWDGSAQCNVISSSADQYEAQN